MSPTTAEQSDAEDVVTQGAEPLPMPPAPVQENTTFDPLQGLEPEISGRPGPEVAEIEVEVQQVVAQP